VHQAAGLARGQAGTEKFLQGALAET